MGHPKRGKEFKGDCLARLRAEACRFHDEISCIRAKSYNCGGEHAFGLEEAEEGDEEDGSWDSAESLGCQIRSPSSSVDGNRTAKASKGMDKFRGSLESSAHVGVLPKQPLSGVKTSGESPICKRKSHGNAVVEKTTPMLRNNSAMEQPVSTPRKNSATEIQCSVQSVVCNESTEVGSRKIVMNSKHQECHSHADGSFRITASTFFTANRGQLVLSTPSFHDETVQQAVKTVPKNTIYFVNVQSKVTEEAECSQQQTTACSVPRERTELTGKSNEDSNRNLAAGQGEPVTFYCHISDNNEVGTFLKGLSGELEQGWNRSCTMGLENGTSIARNPVPAELVISSNSLHANAERLRPVANVYLHSHSHVCSALNKLSPAVIVFSDKEESKQEIHEKKSTAEMSATNLHSQNKLSSNIIELDNQYQQDKVATSLSSTYNAEPISTSLVLDCKEGNRKSSSAVKDMALARRMALRIRCILERLDEKRGVTQNLMKTKISTSGNTINPFGGIFPRETNTSMLLTSMPQFRQENLESNTGGVSNQPEIVVPDAESYLQNVVAALSVGKSSSLCDQLQDQSTMTEESNALMYSCQDRGISPFVESSQLDTYLPVDQVARHENTNDSYDEKRGLKLEYANQKVPDLKQLSVQGDSVSNKYEALNDLVCTEENQNVEMSSDNDAFLKVCRKKVGSLLEGTRLLEKKAMKKPVACNMTFDTGMQLHQVLGDQPTLEEGSSEQLVRNIASPYESSKVVGDRALAAAGLANEIKFMMAQTTNEGKTKPTTKEYTVLERSKLDIPVEAAVQVASQLAKTLVKDVKSKITQAKLQQMAAVQAERMECARKVVKNLIGESFDYDSMYQDLRSLQNERRKIELRTKVQPRQILYQKNTISPKQNIEPRLFSLSQHCEPGTEWHLRTLRQDVDSKIMSAVDPAVPGIGAKRQRTTVSPPHESRSKLLRSSLGKGCPMLSNGDVQSFVSTLGWPVSNDKSLMIDADYGWKSKQRGAVSNELLTGIGGPLKKNRCYLQHQMHAKTPIGTGRHDSSQVPDWTRVAKKRHGTPAWVERMTKGIPSHDVYKFPVAEPPDDHALQASIRRRSVRPPGLIFRSGMPIQWRVGPGTAEEVTSERAAQWKAGKGMPKIRELKELEQRIHDATSNAEHMRDKAKSKAKEIESIATVSLDKLNDLEVSPHSMSGKAIATRSWTPFGELSAVLDKVSTQDTCSHSTIGETIEKGNVDQVGEKYTPEREELKMLERRLYGSAWKKDQLGEISETKSEELVTSEPRSCVATEKVDQLQEIDVPGNKEGAIILKGDGMMENGSHLSKTDSVVETDEVYGGSGESEKEPTEKLREEAEAQVIALTPMHQESIPANMILNKAKDVEHSVMREAMVAGCGSLPDYSSALSEEVWAQDTFAKSLDKERHDLLEGDDMLKKGNLKSLKPRSHDDIAAADQLHGRTESKNIVETMPLLEEPMAKSVSHLARGDSVKILNEVYRELNEGTPQLQRDPPAECEADPTVPGASRMLMHQTSIPAHTRLIKLKDVGISPWSMIRKVMIARSWSHPEDSSISSEDGSRRDATLSSSMSESFDRALEILSASSLEQSTSNPSSKSSVGQCQAEKPPWLVEIPIKVQHHQGDLVSNSCSSRSEGEISTKMIASVEPGEIYEEYDIERPKICDNVKNESIDFHQAMELGEVPLKFTLIPAVSVNGWPGPVLCQNEEFQNSSSGEVSPGCLGRSM